MICPIDTRLARCVQLAIVRSILIDLRYINLLVHESDPRTTNSDLKPLFLSAHRVINPKYNTCNSLRCYHRQLYSTTLVVGRIQHPSDQIAAAILVITRGKRYCVRYLLIIPTITAELLS
jgi:hypothetical protein